MVPARGAQHISAPCFVKGHRQPGFGGGRRPPSAQWRASPAFGGPRGLRTPRSVAGADGTDAWVAVAGDTVTLHYLCKDEAGHVIDSSRDRGEPVTFEVGAGDATGNPLFQAFDSAIRGLPLGEVAKMEAKGGEWNQELLFNVPHDHQEVVRLEGRYKNVGGLSEGMLVELANGATAMVVKLSPEGVTLDANSMMAGKTRVFELELVGIVPRQM